MSYQKALKFLLVLVFVSFGAQAASKFAQDGLPETADVKEYFNFIAQLDLNDSRVEFADGSGGMSINLEFKTPWGMGDFMSNNPDGMGDNGAGHPEGQILAYNLSRVLGYSAAYGRGSWYQISGHPVKMLRLLAESAVPRNVHIEKSQQRILQSTLQEKVLGSVSFYGPKPYNLDGLAQSSGASNGAFNTRSVLAPMIQASGPQPVERLMQVGRYSMRELATAKTLSTIFLIDALTEQWDRFSGGNIQVVRDGGNYRLVSYDNGGAGVPGWGGAYVKKYLGWTTRFDVSVAQQILAMQAFVNEGTSKRFLGFTEVEVFLKALGLRKFKGQFKKHLGTVAEHIHATLDANGESAAYFRDRPQ